MIITGPIGAILGGFIGGMIFGGFLLWFAGSPNRSRGMAIALRIVAVVLTVGSIKEYYRGTGLINPGNVVAAVLVTIWAIAQQLKRKRVDA